MNQSLENMTVGILTVNDQSNYGNRLQNYAIQKLLGRFSHDVVTVYGYLGCNNSFALLKKKMKRKFLHPLKTRLFAGLPSSRQLLGRQRRRFDEFTARYINDTRCSVSSVSGLEAKGQKPGIFVLGSDQIWNDRWLTPSDLVLRLGGFSAQEPVISYAASFGVDEVEDNYKKIFESYLPRLSAISVREEKAVSLVKSLSGQQAQVVLDPTLMLSPDEWLTITNGFVPDDDRYVLTYFLGKPTAAQDARIRQYAEANHCRIRRILDPSDPETYVAGPAEFVELIQKAQYVFTDSYHACCFSVLFNVQFKVFSRSGIEKKSNMNSRMETLFHLFELGKTMEDEDNSKPIDYEKVNRLLDSLRNQSNEWLFNALSAAEIR